MPGILWVLNKYLWKESNEHLKQYKNKQKVFLFLFSQVKQKWFLSPERKAQVLTVWPESAFIDSSSTKFLLSPLEDISGMSGSLFIITTQAAV